MEGSGWFTSPEADLSQIRAAVAVGMGAVAAVSDLALHRRALSGAVGGHAVKWTAGSIVRDRTVETAQVGGNDTGRVMAQVG